MNTAVIIIPYLFLLLLLLIWFIAAKAKPMIDAAKAKESKKRWRAGFDHAAGVLLRNELNDIELTMDVLFARLQRAHDDMVWNESDDGVLAALQQWKIVYAQ